MNPPRFFTVAEAEALLPAVRVELERMRESLAFLRKTSATAPQTSGPEPSLQDEVSDSAMYAWALGRLEAAGRKLADLGVEVRDVDRGLLDFPAIHGGGIILLCWLEGEEHIEWFHGPDTGFGGRRPLADLEAEA